MPSNSSCWAFPVALLPQRNVWQTGIYRQQTSSSKRWLKYTAIKAVHSGKALHGHHNSAPCRRGCQAKFLPSNSSCWVVPIALLPQRHVWQTGIYRQQTSSSKRWLKYTAIKAVHSGKALHGHHNSALCRRGCQAKFFPINSSWVVPVASLPQRHVWQSGIYRLQTSSSKRWLKYTAIKTVHSGKALHSNHNSAPCRRGCQAKFLPSNSSCWVVPIALLPQRHVWQTGIYRQQTSSSKRLLKYTAIKAVHSGKALHGHHNSALCRRGCQAKFFPINSSWDVPVALLTRRNVWQTGIKLVVPVALLPQRHAWQTGIYRQQTSSSKRWLKYTAIKTVHSGKALHSHHNSAPCRRVAKLSSCQATQAGLFMLHYYLNAMYGEQASTASKHPLASAG